MGEMDSMGSLWIELSGSGLALSGTWHMSPEVMEEAWEGVWHQDIQRAWPGQLPWFPF